jgi:hypothetical protein
MMAIQTTTGSHALSQKVVPRRLEQSSNSQSLSGVETGGLSLKKLPECKNFQRLQLEEGQLDVIVRIGHKLILI